MRFNPAELMVVLVIVIILFGAGRIRKVGGELGSGIRAFRDGLKGDDEDENISSDKPDENQKE